MTENLTMQDFEKGFIIAGLITPANDNETAGHMRANEFSNDQILAAMGISTKNTNQTN